MMQQVPEAAALRRAAEQLEATFDDLASFTDASFPNAIGDLKRFPRPSPEDEVTAQGFEALREDTVRAVTVLRAVARALNEGVPVSPSVLAFVRQRYGVPLPQPGEQTEGVATPPPTETAQDGPTPEDGPARERT
jgi:hypothetical protein